MHCEHCGHKIQLGNLFCPHCGERVRPNSRYKRLNNRYARVKGEILTLVLTVGLIVFGVPLFVASELAGDKGLTPLYLLGAILIIIFGICVALFFVLLIQKQFLGNALHVEKSHFGHLKLLVTDLSQRMDMPEPDLFIFQNPLLNAFALGFKRPYTIALHSAIVDELDDEEELAILAHEMGHIYFGHTRVTAYISPIGQAIPVVSYLFGFWSRKAELSADRLALYVTQNPRAVIDALIKVHAGPHFLKELDAEGILFQEYASRGFLSLLSQTLADHPFMTTRIKELLRVSGELGLEYVDKSGNIVCTNCGLKLKREDHTCTRCGHRLASGSA